MFGCLFVSSKAVHMKLNIFINHFYSLFSNIKHWILFDTLIYFIHNKYFCYRWKIRAAITCEYAKRTFLNTHGTGEISNWDLSDASGSITLVAFNLNSHMMTNKLRKDKVIDFQSKIK
jgi:hypothetical protein